MVAGKVKVINEPFDMRRRKIIYLVPVFLGAVALGFLLELSAYESLNLSEIKLVIARLPQRWSPVVSEHRLQPEVDPSISVEEVHGLEEQSENETVFLENVSKAPEFWEQPNLLNLDSFKWIMNDEHRCQYKPGENPNNTYIMPVLVHTARPHFADRLALRRSFGSIPIYKKWDVRFVFLLGQADLGSKPDETHLKQLEEQERKLQEEQKQYGDIVIGSFIDSYHNLTYKHLMGYKWVLNFCPNATFVLKIDDDMFIDILRWINWRVDDFNKLSSNSSAKIPDLYCHTFGGTKPIRQKNSKWYASVEDWPDENYPDYCSGWAYAITVPFIQKLYSMTKEIPFFWIDDVYATGALLEALKLKDEWRPTIKHIWGNVTSDMKEYRTFCDGGSVGKREFRAVAYVPRGDLFERDMVCMWNKTVKDCPDFPK